MPEQYYSVEDVARMLQISVSKIRQLVKSGELESVRIGKQIRITETALNSYISKQRSH
jgi:excisionase family DNA binding protein